MRLVCPNCEAKYEVPEDAIPDVGRDVQCASCGHSWFQMRPRPAATVAETPLSVAPEPAPADGALVKDEALAEADQPAPTEEIPAVDAPVVDEPLAEVPAADVVEVLATVAAAEAETAEAETASAESVLAEAVVADVTVLAETPAEVAAPPEDEIVLLADSAAAEDLSETAEEPAAAAETATATDADTAGEPVVEAAVTSEPELEPEPEAEPEPAPTPTAAAAYAVDESVLAILREEAEREVQARRAEANPLESQTDLGLDAAMAGRVKSGSSKSNGAALGDDSAALKSSARRDLLPDVEEINSTLRPSEVPVEDFIQPGPPPREGNGFRSGFLMVMAVAIIGTGIYTAAPSLSVMVPALAGPLKAYVSAVDSLRLSLDGVMQSATVAINGG